MITCAVVACVLAIDATAAVRLACRGSTDFGVELDLSLGRLAGAHLVDAHSFELRDAGDAVIFHRDRAIDGRRAFEWISISRVSGRYAHFIAFREPAAGSLESSRLIAAATCEIST